MKKVFTVFFLLFAALSLFAGGIENNSNMSAGYMRNPSKNTETKKPDAVFYNPAGTAFMEKGLYIELGNQMINLTYSSDASNTPTNDEFITFNKLFLFPNGEIVWNTENYALFAGASIIAKGGMIEYDNGSYSSTNVISALGFPGTPHSFDNSAIVYGEVLGGSYAVNDFISASAAVRFAQGIRTVEFILDFDPGLGTTVLQDSVATANGIGAVFGVHINASEKLDVSFQYQTRINLEFEYTDVEGFGPYLTAAEAEEGDKFDHDIPAVLSSGIGYQLYDDLYTSMSFNYFFNENAALDRKYNDSWEIGVGAEFTFSSIAVLSGGLLYSKQGYRDDLNSPEAPVLDSLTVASGVGLTFIDDLIIDIGFAKPFYFADDYDSGVGMIKLDRNLFLIGVGATYKIF